MNLLSFLKEDVKSRNITDKLDITRHLYNRTGELFIYDPEWIFTTQERREQLREKEIDLTNVTENDFYIVCFSWARMFVKLLREFGISAKVKYENTPEYDDLKKQWVLKTKHAYVEVFIKDKVYLADLTASMTDMVAIKYGFKTEYNCVLYRKLGQQQYFGETFDEARDLYMEGVLPKLKQELLSLKQNGHFNSEMYIYQVYKVIERIVNSSPTNADFVTGQKYVKKLLKEIIDPNYNTYNTYFYDTTRGVYIAIYSMQYHDQVHYFSYEKGLNGAYQLLEVPRERIDYYAQTYQSLYIHNILYAEDLQNPMDSKSKVFSYGRRTVA